MDNFPVYDFVDEDGKLLGFTETDCYFEYRCEPGRHLFLTWGEGEAFIDADLAPGKTYYIQAWSKFGILSSRPGFAPAPPGSDAYRELEEAWSRLRCRELDPSKVPSYESRKEDRVLQARADYEAGRLPAKTIIQDEGLSEPSLEAK